jgi:hypothetical protein
MKGPHLNINRISITEPTRGLPNGIIGMAFKNVKIGDSLSVKEWTSHTAVKSDIWSAFQQERAIKMYKLPHIT